MIEDEIKTAYWNKNIAEIEYNESLDNLSELWDNIVKCDIEINRLKEKLNNIFLTRNKS